MPLMCVCKRCSGSILMGDKCYDIPNPRESFSNARRFCAAGLEGDRKTKSDLAALEMLQLTARNRK